MSSLANGVNIRIPPQMKYAVGGNVEHMKWARMMVSERD